MGNVVVDISMSLDGFVAARGADLKHGLGIGGEPIHEWAFAGHSADQRVLDDTVAGTGAVVMGRRLFDYVDGPNGWQGDLGYGGERARWDPPPYYVVTHNAPESIRLDGEFTFVTDGIASAIEQAKSTAGDKDVVIMGGANVCAQTVEQHLADAILIHVAPILVGDGTRLFEYLGCDPIRLDISDVIHSPHATHIYYGVRNPT